MTYITRTLKTVVMPEGDEIISENALTVEIINEGAGEFVELSSQHPECGPIRIDPDEWEAVKAEIDRTFNAIKNNQVKK